MAYTKTVHTMSYKCVEQIYYFTPNFLFHLKDFPFITAVPKLGKLQRKLCQWYLCFLKFSHKFWTVHLIVVHVTVSKLHVGYYKNNIESLVYKCSLSPYVT